MFPKIPSPEEVGFIIDAFIQSRGIVLEILAIWDSTMMEDIKVLRAIGPQLIKVVWNKLVNTDTLINWSEI